MDGAADRRTPQSSGDFVITFFALESHIDHDIFHLNGSDQPIGTLRKVIRIGSP
jgi:hypothetical protein